MEGRPQGRGVGDLYTSTVLVMSLGRPPVMAGWSPGELAWLGRLWPRPGGRAAAVRGRGGQGAGFRGYVRMSSLVWKVGVGKGRVALTTCPTLEQAITGTGG